MRDITLPGTEKINSFYRLRHPGWEERVKRFRKSMNITRVEDFIKYIRIVNYMPDIYSIITEDGDPVTTAEYPAYSLDDDLLSDLSHRQQKDIMLWIEENIRERKTPNEYLHTYRLKHMMQYDIGLYVTDNQFKDAMLKSGYYPIDKYEKSWTFCIALKNRKRIEEIYARGRYIKPEI